MSKLRLHLVHYTAQCVWHGLAFLLRIALTVSTADAELKIYVRHGLQRIYYCDFVLELNKVSIYCIYKKRKENVVQCVYWKMHLA